MSISAQKAILIPPLGSQKSDKIMSCKSVLALHLQTPSASGSIVTGAKKNSFIALILFKNMTPVAGFH